MCREVCGLRLRLPILVAKRGCRKSVDESPTAVPVEKEEPHKAMLTQVSIRENMKEIVNKIDLQWETKS